MERILIAEDQARLAGFLEKGLRAQGYRTTVARNGSAALALARDADFDLLLLDLGLPHRDGLEVLVELRRRGERLPALVLTARADPETTVASLEAGADDYMTKPFRFAELLARVRARLRTEPEGGEPVLRHGGVVLDLRTRCAVVAGERVQLSGRESALLETFLRRPGEVLSREQLLGSVWDRDAPPLSNVVDVYVRCLRRKLGPAVLQTVRATGYRFVTPGAGDRSGDVDLPQSTGREPGAP